MLNYELFEEDLKKAVQIVAAGSSSQKELNGDAMAYALDVVMHKIADLREEADKQVK